MKKKLLVLGIASLFLLTSSVSLTAISITEEQVLSDQSSDSKEVQLLDENNEDEIPETIELTNDERDQLYSSLKYIEDIEIRRAIKQAIQNSATITDNGVIINVEVLKDEMEAVKTLVESNNYINKDKGWQRYLNLGLFKVEICGTGDLQTPPWTVSWSDYNEPWVAYPSMIKVIGGIFPGINRKTWSAGECFGFFGEGIVH